MLPETALVWAPAAVAKSKIAHKDRKFFFKEVLLVGVNYRESNARFKSTNLKIRHYKFATTN
jgi:hypothetical protein